MDEDTAFASARHRFESGGRTVARFFAPGDFFGCRVHRFASLVAYHNSFAVPFLFDDQTSIVDNTAIRRVLSPVGGGATVDGRPLLSLSLALNYAVGGTKVWGCHAVNLAIHILASLILFGIV